jgi:16S rRNA (cytosine967-C5)-methyltransferase
LKTTFTIPRHLLDYTTDFLRRRPEDMRLDEALRSWARGKRQISPADQRKVVGLVLDLQRWQGWTRRQDRMERRVTVAAEYAQRFARNPRSIDPGELLARAVPAWVWDHLPEGTDDARRLAWVRSLQTPAPLWLRARPGKAVALLKELGDCEPAARVAGVPRPAFADALRYTGVRDLHLAPPYREGRCEIQDLASQIVAHACGARPGETWWDTCAGEGGKSLHLADLMENKGLLWCSDRSALRLARLRKRFARAQRFNLRVARWVSTEHLPTKTKFDGVLVDAPCSGLGTWRRYPEGRWTTKPDDIAELALLQQALLAAAAAAVKPGGRLVYAVCTLARDETTAIAAHFGATHRDRFEPAPVFPAEPRSPNMLQLWPQDLDANGMYIAAWRCVR